jgi:hypothetical protein
MKRSTRVGQADAPPACALAKPGIASAAITRPRRPNPALALTPPTTPLA